MALSWLVNVKWNGTTTDNLVSNPSLESDTTGWSSFGSPSTFARSTTEQRFGDASLQIVTATSTPRGGSCSASVAANTVYTYSVWSKIGAGSFKLQVNGNVSGVLSNNNDMGAADSQWRRTTVTFATGASDSAVTLYILSTTAVSSGYFDGIQLEQASGATPYYDGVWGDERDRLQHLQVTRGKHALLSPAGNGFAPQEIGTCTLTLKNYDGRYDPLNTNSPLYPGIEPGKEVLIQVSDGTVYGVIRGHISNIQPIRGDGGANTKKVKVTIKDAWQWLQDRNITSAPQADILTSAAINTLLTAAAYPFATSIFAGWDTIPYWWADNRNARDAVQSLSDSEFGLVWIGVEGKIYFRRRPYQWQIASSATFTGAEITEIDFAQPWDVMRNVIQVRAYPSEVIPKTDPRNPYLWRNEKVFKVRPTEAVVLNVKYTYNGNPTSAFNIVTPVATTDYKAFETATGKGDNLTSLVSVSLSAKGSESSLTITNNSTKRTVHITFLQLRGDVINRMDAVQVETDVSGGSNRRTFVLDEPWQQDVEMAHLQADYLARFLQDPRAAPVIRTNTQKATLAKQMADLNTVQTLNISSEGINQAYRRCGVEHEWDAHQPNLIQSTLYYEATDTSTYWTLNTSQLNTSTILAH